MFALGGPAICLVGKVIVVNLDADMIETAYMK
jgi:hypothetical protein